MSSLSSASVATFTSGADCLSLGSVELFALPFVNSHPKAAADAIAAAGQRRERGLVITPNVDHIVTLHERPELRPIYDRALWLLPDGMPIVWLSRLAGRRLQSRIPGSDLLFDVCEFAASRGVSVFFLGGRAGAAQAAADVLRARNPSLRITGTYCPPFGFEHDEAECARIVDMCNAARPDILFIGVGAPKQEIWADRFAASLDCGPIVCVGGSFEFAAGLVTRAPRVVQVLGLEWAWRLLHEPRRLWRRYLVRDPRFLILALRELMGLKSAAPRREG